MELYRHFHGTDQSCRSHKYLGKLLLIGVPDLDLAQLRIDDLQKRDQTVFYPRSKTKTLFNREAITNILRCRCDICSRHLLFSDADLQDMLDSILNERKPKVLLLAVLVYLGRSYMIQVLSRLDSLNDTKLLSLHSSTLEPAIWAKLLEIQPRPENLSRESLECFLKNYELVVHRFCLPEFSPREVWKAEYASTQRFPFIDDEAHREGSFGKVRKFNIHVDYLDIKVKHRDRSCDTSEKRYTFARKVLQKKTTDRLDWRLEWTVLKAISAQGHPNIIELLWAYQWRDQYNFVFPFVERNLHDVIRSQWSPQNNTTTMDTPFEEYWLWQQMVQVASGLEAIHQPSGSSLDSSSRIIGFHLDLKPANILVTDDGLLKITDFGQALIKTVGANDSTYGVNRGGSLVYQAPEARPTRQNLESENVDGRVHRRYDVWSLACIMLEVITYVFEGPEDGTKEFERARRDEPITGAFFTAAGQPRLKRCVELIIEKYRNKSTGRPYNSEYLQEVLDLIRHMLSIKQQSRPSSEEVNAKLKSFQQVLLCIQHRRFHSRQEIDACFPVCEGYEDVGWQVDSTWLSFLELENLYFRPCTDASTSNIPCQFRITMHSKNGNLMLERFSGKETLKKDCFLLSDKSYVPLDLYGIHDTLACIAGESFAPWILDLKTTEALLGFRGVVSQNKVIPNSQLVLRSVTLYKPGGSAPETMSGNNIRLEIWRRQKAQPLASRTRRSSRGITADAGNGGSSCLRIMIFIHNERRFLNIPLHKGENCITKPERGLEQSSTILIVPNQDNYHQRFFISDLQGHPDRLQPSLPLSLQGFEKLESKKISLVRLQFKHDQGMLCFRNLIMDYSKNLWR